MGARAWPFGAFAPVPKGLGCGTRCAQTVLAPISNSGPGRSLARRRLGVAPWDGALQLHNTKTKERKKRHGMARGHMQKTLDPRLLMSRMTEGGEGGEGGPH